MLRYCAWCGEFQGGDGTPGVQIRPHVCEIDTATICPACMRRLLMEPPPRFRRAPGR